MKLSHVGFVVGNISYARGIWLRKGYVEVLPVVYDSIQNVYCCLLQFENEVPVELVSPGPEGDSPISARLSKGGGIDHICYETDDLEKQLAQLVSAGYRIVVEPTYAILFKSRISFLMSPGGLLVEYVEIIGDLHDY